MGPTAEAVAGALVWRYSEVIGEGGGSADKKWSHGQTTEN